VSSSCFVVGVEHVGEEAINLGYLPLPRGQSRISVALMIVTTVVLGSLSIRDWSQYQSTSDLISRSRHQKPDPAPISSFPLRPPAYQ
jgi:hypothetical protein